MAEVKPFKVAWSEAAIAKVMDRVRAYPWDEVPVPVGGHDGWSYGTDAAYLKALCAYWTDGYDWRAVQDDLNRWPQFTARIEDFDIHFVHVVGEAGGKRPILLSHGWPGSHYEFWGAIEKLAFPSRHGGKAEDAFDVVVPSLPGFGFSSKPKKPFGQRGTARLFNKLMTEVLGYPTYLAQGGDWGALITSYLAWDHPAQVRSIHLNMTGLQPHGGPKTQEEIDWATAQGPAGAQLGAYLRLQMTKPQSLAWMAGGNPVGQCAWIVERFYDWSDRKFHTFEKNFTRDQLLTNVMIYVMTDSFTTGAWYYRALPEEDGVRLQAGQRLETPTAFANFPGEALYQAPPRSWAERAYNVVRWSPQPSGGHFAAMEQPDLFVDDVRAWARDLEA